MGSAPSQKEHRWWSDVGGTRKKWQTKHIKTKHVNDSHQGRCGLEHSCQFRSVLWVWLWACAVRLGWLCYCLKAKHAAWGGRHRSVTMGKAICIFLSANNRPKFAYSKRIDLEEMCSLFVLCQRCSFLHKSLRRVSATPVVLTKTSINETVHVMYKAFPKCHRWGHLLSALKLKPSAPDIT